MAGSDRPWILDGAAVRVSMVGFDNGDQVQRRDLAHRKLDQAAFAAYAWPQGLSEDEILGWLLALNLERAAKQAS